MTMDKKNTENGPEIIFRGRVVRGSGQGKDLGFPTANLDVNAIDLGHGVYLAEVELEGRIYPGLLHFGIKKTFNGGLTAEVHIKGFKRDIYGQELGVRVIKKIRDVKKFDNFEELKAQIALDVKNNF